MKNVIYITALLILITVSAIPLQGKGGSAGAAVDRRIEYRPASPRVGQQVTFESINFITQSVDWNFGDGTVIPGGNRTVRHRFQAPGTYTVSAKDTPIDHIPVTTVITISPDDRDITVSPAVARVGETVAVTAHNFRAVSSHWDFGDGTQRVGGHTETHRYVRTGIFTITAREDDDEFPGEFTTRVTVVGIDDQVRLETVEILLDNGRQYKVVPKNSKDLRALLRMKLDGTGTLSGYWIVDGQPFEFFNRMVNAGELKEIYTNTFPGLPTMDAGLHTVTLQLTQPADLAVTFPTLKYFVLPREIRVEITGPPDRFVAKEDEIPTFSWKKTEGAAVYRIAFSNALYPLLSDEFDLEWHDAGAGSDYSPGVTIWKNIKRNRWTYWSVRALDSEGKMVAASDVHEIKVVIAAAEINIKKVTDLEGREIGIAGGDRDRVRSTADSILVHGSIKYMGDSEYIVLRVYVDNRLTDQLLFRDVKKDREIDFETFLPHRKPGSRVLFNLLKTSSPAVIIGIKEFILKK